jgi:hypothetical protein
LLSVSKCFIDSSQLSKLQKSGITIKLRFTS